MTVARNILPKFNLNPNMTPSVWVRTAVSGAVIDRFSVRSGKDGSARGNGWSEYRETVAETGLSRDGLRPEESFQIVARSASVIAWE
jgi:hypothetical protein